MINATKRMTNVAKIVLVGLGVVGLLGVGYLASRVGNIAARGVRDGGGRVELTVSDPIVPGVAVKASWNTALGQESMPVVLRGRGREGEVAVGKSEFGVGQAMIAIPCEMGSQTIAVSLYAAPNGQAEELLAWTSAQILPAGPDCLR